MKNLIFLLFLFSILIIYLLYDSFYYRKKLNDLKINYNLLINKLNKCSLNNLEINKIINNNKITWAEKLIGNITKISTTLEINKFLDNILII